MAYDITTHGDFQRYFSTSQKRNIWLLGYFGGGAVNICEAMVVAEQYAKETGVPVETVKIDEVLKSRRYKGFKFVYSNVEQKPCGDKNIIMDNVYEHICD